MNINCHLVKVVPEYVLVMVVPDPAVRVFSELSPSFQTTVGSVRVEATQDKVTRDPCTTPSEVGDVVIPGGGGFIKWGVI